MYIFGYLRASAHDQDASRAQQRLKAFALEHNHRVAGWYVENASGASLQRPELMRLLNDAEKGDLIRCAVKPRPSGRGYKARFSD
ncbi:hypothetical protein EFZ10_16520 (plasmid) [Tatumella sp. TA1]|nr:hypothetical protein EFZ10_16520 [Tatumella sp. TA1]